ncbi:MAG: hypothetical protein IPK18_03935 [Sphingobacteriales bacterium]|jgi:hypothetical protein|nr:MAG: hypothetical protein IPK18_03935 [Sphingobacteriales bacterium]
MTTTIEYIEPKQGKAYVTANEIAYERIIKTLPNYIAEKYSVTYNEKTDEIIIKGKADNADNEAAKIKTDNESNKVED